MSDKFSINKKLTVNEFGKIINKIIKEFKDENISYWDSIKFTSACTKIFMENNNTKPLITGVDVGIFVLNLILDSYINFYIEPMPIDYIAEIKFTHIRSLSQPYRFIIDLKDGSKIIIDFLLMKNTIDIDAKITNMIL